MSTKLRARKSRSANVRARKIEEGEKSVKNQGARKIKARKSAKFKAKKEGESASAKPKKVRAQLCSSHVSYPTHK
jgi:hypothetical protein